MENRPPTVRKGFASRALLSLFYAAPVLIVLGFVGLMGYNHMAHKPPPVREISAKPLATVKINDLFANLFAQGDTLRASGNDVFIEFRDASGKLVDVGEVTFELDLHMTSMVMHNTWKPMRTATPGQYRATIDPQIAGEWTAKITTSGPHSHAEGNLKLEVK